MSKNLKELMNGWKSNTDIVLDIINIHNFLVMNAHAHSYSYEAAANYLNDSPNKNLKLYFNHYHDRVEESLAAKLMTWETKRLKRLKKDLSDELIRVIPLINFEFAQIRLNAAIAECGDEGEPQDIYDQYFEHLEFSDEFKMVLEEEIILSI
jgi:hypothetical protein